MPLTPDVLLRAYACGVFPMAGSADDANVFWVEPDHRGILPLEGFHVPRRLARTLRQDRYRVLVNTAFSQVMEYCAESRPSRQSTWINGTILALYQSLHQTGHAHSVEVWLDGQLVGGLYGVSLGQAFFGESMFSRQRDASKIALCHLVARLIGGGFRLLDTQYLTEHLSQFGAMKITREAYLQRLLSVIEGVADFAAADAMDGDTALRLIQSKGSSVPS